jgi:serine/threonine protein kinase
MRLPSGFDTPVVIGKGAYSTVYRVRQKQLNRQVVIKMIPFSRKKYRNRHFQEAVTQAQLHLPCFPQVYDVQIWKENVCIVMQWIRSLNLQKSLSVFQNDELRLAIAEGVIKAVSAIHSNGYAHRDIKPANILISATEGVFLIDFGFSTKNDANSMANNSIRGTKGYIAPEILENRDSRKIDYFRADCYALGIVLNNILGYDHRYPLLRMLIDPDPSKRPAHAGEAYRIWKNQVNCKGLECFTSDIDRYIRKSFSAMLLDSACQLIALHRYNEAYRLCLESLQEVPDDPDALKMISTFAEKAGKKRIRSKLIVPVIVSAAVSAVLIVFLFLNQPKNLYNSGNAVFTVSDRQILRRPSGNVPAGNIGIQYRYHPSETPSLTSEVHFRVKNVNCMIYIDGKLIGQSIGRKSFIRYNLPAATYRVLITGINGEFIRSERLQVLPFSKIIMEIE